MCVYIYIYNTQTYIQYIHVYTYTHTYIDTHFAYQIFGSGIHVYIHTRSNIYPYTSDNIHTCSNIFLDKSLVAKVADFGMVTAAPTTTEPLGTPQWMAPEVCICSFDCVCVSEVCICSFAECLTVL